MTRKLLLAASAALAPLFATPATAQVAYVNMDGVQADADGNIQRFTGIIVGADGRVETVLSDGIAVPGGYDEIDMGGAVVMPGLIDAHGHVMGLGVAQLQLDLTGTASIAELKQRVADYAAANPDLPWILGRGWNQELFDAPRFPTALDLDEVVGDRPVWLTRVDGHAAVANSTAIRMAEVTAETVDPDGGSIERLADGRPAGVFVDAAEQLVARIIPSTDAATLDRALAEAQRFLLAEGITATADMGTTIADWHAMRRAGDAGDLDVRIMSYSAGVEPAQAIAGTGPTPWLYDGHLRMGGVKLYSDGALGSRGALLKEDYEDQDGHFGLPVMSREQLVEASNWSSRYGFQLAIHAIGDAANEQVISIFENLPDTATDPRHRIEHVQILDPADLPRLANAGIIASMQPVHQTSDWQMAQKRLGMDRLDGAYAWDSLLEAGTRLAFGSDYPVEHPNPFVGLKVSVTREDSAGQPDGGWFPGEAVTFGEALAAFTTGAAYAGQAEQMFGRIAPGQYADFIVIDRNPLEVAPEAIADTRVHRTYVGGELKYEATR